MTHRTGCASFRTFSPSDCDCPTPRYDDENDEATTPTPAPAASLSGVPFQPLEYKYVFDLLYGCGDEKRTSAVLSNNLNVIIAALKIASHFATERKSPWRPIAEAKKDGKPVIVFHPEGGVCEAFCPGDGYAWHCMDGTNTTVGENGISRPRLTSFVTRPTHFMLLPEPPTAPQSPAEGQ